MAALAGIRISEDERRNVASAIHWSLGVATGAQYGVLRNRSARLRIGSGLAYGFAVFLLLDEAALTALHLTPPPQAFPWQTHARGLAGHIILGGIIESVLDVIDLLEGS